MQMRRGVIQPCCDTVCRPVVHWSGCQDLKTMQYKQMRVPFSLNAANCSLVWCGLGCSGATDGHHNAVGVQRGVTLTA